MWKVSLLFLLCIYKCNSLWKKKYFCSIKVNASSAVTNYIHILYPVLIKVTKKIFTRKRPLQNSTEEVTQLPVTVHFSPVSQH